MFTFLVAADIAQIRCTEIELGTHVRAMHPTSTLARYACVASDVSYLSQRVASCLRRKTKPGS